MNASHRRAMAATWSDEETLKRVELWGNEEIQVLLEGCTLRRNKHVYDRIAQEPFYLTASARIIRIVVASFVASSSVSSEKSWRARASGKSRNRGPSL